MNSNLTFNLFGLRIETNWSILLLFILGFVTNNMLFWLTAILFIFIHELGHVIAGWLFKIETEKVVLGIFGGMACFKTTLQTPLQILVVSAGGPLANALLVPITLLCPEQVFWSNLLLLFNLLPIYPLDGGQMLRAALWQWFGLRNGTIYAARISQVFIVVGLVAVVVFGNPIMQILSIIYAWSFWEACNTLIRDVDRYIPPIVSIKQKLKNISGRVYK